MATINIKDFAATGPVVGDRNLPPNMAVTADNIDLRYKYLRPFDAVGSTLNSVTSNDTRSFRLEGDDGSEKWFNFPEKHTDLEKGPVIDDQYERYYWLTPGKTSAEFLKVGSYANINTDEATMTLWNGVSGDYYKVGVPRPRSGASVTVTGGSASPETRFYTYTFINSFGEEGPPAEPFSASGPADGSWDISGMDSWTSHPDATGRNVTNLRVYRTIPSTSGNTQFFRVVDLSIGATTYSDTSTDSVVAADVILQSTYWELPPDQLDGFVISQNGFVVTWKGRNIYVSESYRPHAYPPQYQKTVDFNIVGMEVFGNSIVVCTDGPPYLLAGASPSSMTLTKFNTVEPCLFKRSIVAMGYGVLYASPNGIVLVSNEGVKVLTSNLIASDQWTAYTFGDFVAVKYFNRYLAYYSSTRGIIFDASDAARGFSSITMSGNVRGLEVDMFNGKNYILVGTDVVELAGSTTDREVSTWKSKVFNLGSPENIAAFQFDFDVDSLDSGSSFGLSSDQLAFNAFIYSASFAAPFGGGVFGNYYEPPGNTGISSYLIPFGADQTFQVSYEAVPDGFLRLIVITDQTTTSYDVTSSGVRKMMSGMKSNNWQFEIVTNVDIYEFAAATSAKELKRV